MHLIALLVAFIFLGVAAAGPIQNIAGFSLMEINSYLPNPTDHPIHLSPVFTGAPTLDLPYSAISRTDSLTHSRRSLDGPRHPKPTETHPRPAPSHSPIPTDVSSLVPAPHTTDVRRAPSHHSAPYRISDTSVLPRPSGFPFSGSSDHGSGKPSWRPSHKTYVHGATTVRSYGAEPTNAGHEHHEHHPSHEPRSSDYPKPTGRTA